MGKKVVQKANIKFILTLLITSVDCRLVVCELGLDPTGRGF